jgi:hypothetical protein
MAWASTGSKRGGEEILCVFGFGGSGRILRGTVRVCAGIAGAQRAFYRVKFVNQDAIKAEV